VIRRREPRAVRVGAGALSACAWTPRATGGVPSNWIRHGRSEIIIRRSDGTLPSPACARRGRRHGAVVLGRPRIVVATWPRGQENAAITGATCIAFVRVRDSSARDGVSLAKGSGATQTRDGRARRHQAFHGAGAGLLGAQFRARVDRREMAIWGVLRTREWTRQGQDVLQPGLPRGAVGRLRRGIGTAM